MAHEIGHHLNGHTLLGTGSQPRSELEADQFSGFVLQKMGASLTQAQSAMKVAANIRATTTHPAKEDRLTAIAEGWYKANNQVIGRNDVASVPAPTTPRVQVPSKQTISRPATTSNNRYILYDVRFNADQRAAYYVTTQNQLVTLKGNQLVVIGKLERTNNRSYPFLISDERTSLYVSAQGSIVTANGRQVGIMKNHS